MGALEAYRRATGRWRSPEPVEPERPAPTRSDRPTGEMLDWVDELLRGYTRPPWQEGGWGSEVWDQINPARQGPQPGSWQPGQGPTLPGWEGYQTVGARDVISMARELAGAPEFQVRIPTGWQVRQMAAPAAEANAVAQSRALSEAMRGMRELGGPGVSGAAARQAALGGIAGARAGAESQAASDLLAAGTQMAQTGLAGAMSAMGQAAVGEMELAGQRYRTDVEASTSVWDTQERLRFGGWQQERQDWQSEHLARMGGILDLFKDYGEQMPQWLSNWMALYKLWSESGEPRRGRRSGGRR